MAHGGGGGAVKGMPTEPYRKTRKGADNLGPCSHREKTFRKRDNIRPFRRKDWKKGGGKAKGQRGSPCCMEKKKKKKKLQWKRRTESRCPIRGSPKKRGRGVLAASGEGKKSNF